MQTTRSIFSFITLGACCAWCAQAHAAGFALPDAGAGAAGVGGAATARGDLIEAAYYNPAAFVLRARPRRRIRKAIFKREPWGFAASLGVSMLAPSLRYMAPSGSEGSAQDATSQGGASYGPRIYLGGGVGRLGFAFSFHAPYGSSIRWPEDWTGRTELLSSDLRVLESAPHLAVRIVDELAISAGVRFQSATLGTSRAIAFPDEDASRVRISADAFALAFAFSALYEPLSWLAFGASVRTGSRLDFVGEADFEDVPRELQASARDTPVRVEGVHLPLRAALGGSIELNRFGRLQADLMYYGWHRNEALVIDFEDEAVEDVTQPRQWRRSFTARFGYEYNKLLSGKLALRAGGFVDDTPVPRATLSASSPDGLRLGATAGVGLVDLFSTGLQVQCAGSATHIGHREVAMAGTTPGSYGGRLLALHLDLGYRFGPR